MTLFASQVQQLEVAVGIIQSKNEAQSTELKDQVQLAFAQEKLEIGQIVTQAQSEFNKLREMDTKTQTDIAALYNETNAAVQEIRSQMRILQDQPGGGGGGDDNKKAKCMIYLKDLKPSTFAGKADTWRKWVEEITDYADASTKGCL